MGNLLGGKIVCDNPLFLLIFASECILSSITDQLPIDLFPDVVGPALISAAGVVAGVVEATADCGRCQKNVPRETSLTWCVGGAMVQTHCRSSLSAGG